MFKRWLKIIRDKRGAALISVILLFVGLSIVGISIVGVAAYSHKKSINNWEYTQAHYIARSSAISIRDYAKSIIDKITELDTEIARTEGLIFEEQKKENPNLEPLINMRDNLIAASNAEKAKIESILSVGTNEVKATGRILSEDTDDFEAVITELESGEETYSNRKYRVKSKGRFNNVEAVSTVYINYKPVDEYLPYLGPTAPPSQGGSVGGLMDSFVFYSEVKTIMQTKIEGDVNILRSTNPIAATDNVITGNMYVGSFYGDGGVFAQTVNGNLIAPHSITLHGSEISEAVIVDGDFKSGVGTKINKFVTARGDVMLENSAVVPIIYSSGSVTIGDNTNGATITGVSENGALTAVLAEGYVDIKRSGVSEYDGIRGITGNVISNTGIFVQLSEIFGNAVTTGDVTVSEGAIINGNVIGNGGVKAEGRVIVNGDIHSQNDISVREQSDVNGSIYSKKGIKIDGSEILGSLYSQTDMSVSGSVIGGSVYSKTGAELRDVTVNGGVFSAEDIAFTNSIVEGDIHSKKNITFVGGPEIKGNIISQGDIIIPQGSYGGTYYGDMISGGNISINHGGCIINGNIVAQGDIYIDGGATITGEIISIGGTITDIRKTWMDTSSNYKNPSLYTKLPITASELNIPDYTVFKAEKAEIKLPRIEDTVLKISKFDKLVIPEIIKNKYADVYKEDDVTIVIDSSGKINPKWFSDQWGCAESMIAKGEWGAPLWVDNKLIIDATDNDIDLYLDGDLLFQSTVMRKIIIRGNNLVRLFLEKGSSFVMNDVYITSEANEYAVSNEGLTPPNFYIMASSADLERDIPKITFGATSGINSFEGYIISPSSNIDIVNTRVLGAIVSDSLNRLHNSDMRFFPARKLEQALNGLSYTFKEITVDRNGITERNILNP